jgi:hypothetical protein
MSRCWGGGRRQPDDGLPITPPRGPDGRHQAASRRDATAGHAIIRVLVVALVVLAVVLLLAVAGGLALSSASLRDQLIAPRGATSAIASRPSAPTPEPISNAMARPVTLPGDNVRLSKGIR